METFVGNCLPHNAVIETTYADWSTNAHNGDGHMVMWRNGKRPTAPQIVEPAPIVEPITPAEMAQPIVMPAVIIDPTPDVEPPADSFKEDSSILRQSIAGVNNVVLEREDTVKQAEAAIIAQSTMMIYGTKGNAKSMLVRAVAEAVDRSYWDTTISAFTSLDDLFGAYDLIKMHDEGLWERHSAGMLTHDVIFLDELGNSSAPVRDAIKTAINERVYRNGDIEIALPLQTLFAASNSRLLDSDATEDAFADRFVIRAVVYDLQEDENWVRAGSQRHNRPLIERIPAEVITRMQARLLQVEMSDSFIRSANALRKQIIGDPAAGIEHGISVRRFNQTLDLCAAHALIQGRMKVNRSDLIAFSWTMWSDPENEYMPLQNWFRANLRTAMTLLEGYRSAAEQEYNAWRQRVNDQTAPMSPAERMQFAMTVRPKLAMTRQMLTSVRPNLEDQDETDYANALEADFVKWDNEMKSDFFGNAPKVENAEAMILESLKKA